MKSTVSFGRPFSKSYYVKPLDCDSLKVMSAQKYPIYMDFMDWELITRSELFPFFKKKCLEIVGAQKVIYITPLTIGSKFEIKLETIGWDHKWFYHLYEFIQKGEVKAIGIRKVLVWKSGLSQQTDHVVTQVGISPLIKEPPKWVKNVFKEDKSIVKHFQGEIKPLAVIK